MANSSIIGVDVRTGVDNKHKPAGSVSKMMQEGQVKVAAEENLAADHAGDGSKRKTDPYMSSLSYYVKPANVK